MATVKMATLPVEALAGRALTHIKHQNAYVQHRGDALAPTIAPRQWVEVDPNVTAFDGPGIYLTAWKNFTPQPHYPQQVPQLRRLDYIDGVLHSIPDNPVVPPVKFDLATALIGGKAVGY